MAADHSHGGKQRIDLLLVERGLAPSRNRAQAYILAGRVLVDEQRVNKAGMRVPVDAQLRVKGPDHPYVGREGVKLQHALEDLRGRVLQSVDGAQRLGDAVEQLDLLLPLRQVSTRFGEAHLVGERLVEQVACELGPARRALVVGPHLDGVPDARGAQPVEGPVRVGEPLLLGRDVFERPIEVLGPKMDVGVGP